MLRRSITPRLLRIAFVLAVCAGVGLGIAGLWSIASAQTPAPRVGTTASTASALDGPGTSTAPSTATAPPTQAPAGPLTADQATAIATQAYPGQVVEVQQDNQATEPQDATESQDASDPQDATDPAEQASEPTGLVYDVTIQHDDGTITQVEVDATTGQIVSVKQDDQSDGN